MPARKDDLATLRRRALQFLVHSFLYYRAGESLVSDVFFDRISEELRELRAKHPRTEMPYAELIDPVLGPEASAYSIREYPPRIVSTAFKLLYAAGSPGIGFAEFVERHGYQAVINPPDG